MSEESGTESRSKVDNVRVFRAHQVPTAGRVPLNVDPVLVLVADNAALTFQIETLRGQGCDVVVSADRRQIRDLLGMPDGYWAMLIVEIEGFGGISAVIGSLMTLRREQPELPVIIASTRTPSHDFSQERLPICDASLALPSIASELSVALQNAVSNNQAWRKRLEDLHQVNAAEDDEVLPVFAEAG